MCKYFLIPIILIFSLSITAQTTTEGDSSVEKSIQEKASKIYDNKDTTLYFLTKQNLQKIRTLGSDITVFKKDKKVNRITITSTTPKGKIGAEFYIWDDQLIFVYQTFSYFKETPSLSKAVNFKGERYWESRYYFENEQLKYQKTTGVKEAGMKYSAQDLLGEKNKLLQFINQ